MAEVTGVVSFDITDGFLNLAVDPNKNGTPVIKLAINLAEIPTEVLSLINGKKPA
jgi:hypothetical protein